MLLELYATLVCENETCTETHMLTLNSPEVLRENYITLLSDRWICPVCTKNYDIREGA